MRRATALSWLGGAALLAFLAVDFHLDVRERDVFSWMDPTQYYDFALAVVRGERRFDGFEVPSLFPFFVMPLLALRPSIPAALWVNFGATLLLLPALHALRREVGLRTPTPLVAALVLSSPLLVGLSRELYVEYALCALVAAAFAAWLRFLRRGAPRSELVFGALFGLGFLTKTTFPLFFALPVAAAVAGSLAARRGREALARGRAALVPLLLVVGVQWSVFPASFGYYRSLGNTALPIMFLIGPPEWLSAASAAYYPGEVGRTLLFLLTPLLALAAWDAWRRRGPFGAGALAGPRAALWLWLAGPLLLLAFQPVKEPRHVAPCVVPALLLGVLAVESLPRPPLRRALLAGALLLAGLQYGAVTGGWVQAPYFLDRALHWREIRAAMVRSDPTSFYARTPPALRELHRSYDQNVALAGFPPNEALAIIWQLFPGVVFDLDAFEEAGRWSDRIPYQRFEDLYLLSAFNAYNRRCGWRHYLETLSRDRVVANADFVIANGGAAERFPDHAVVAAIARDGGVVRVLRRRGRTTLPYRSLYAREFLRRHPVLPEAERRVVAEELLRAAVLGGYARRARALLSEFPELREGGPARNIYWIGGYPALVELARSRRPAPTR